MPSALAMAPKLKIGRTLRSALPDGYAFVVLKYLQEFESESGTKTSLFSDVEQDEIYTWLNEDTPDVPDGWFPPDAWRYRCLKKVNGLRNVLANPDLAEIVENILEAETFADVDARWRVPPKAGEGGSSSLGNLEGTSEIGDNRPPPPRMEKPRLKEVIGWKEIAPAIEGGEEKAQYLTVVKWLSSGNATIGSCPVRPHRSSKASGSKFHSPVHPSRDRKSVV